MANFHLSSRKKRGPQPSSLSVRLFLLDPDKEITKVTRETCSKRGIEWLMQKGCGQPQPEHCVSDGKVEFSLGLTNEQFKQKLVEIYPKLENACFVFMKADKKNKLEELNHGMCCFRCYTPENVYHSERGQGRLYIRKIAESEISQCTHGVSPFKRLCVFPSYSQQRFVPIQPKLLPAACTITGIESRPLLVPPGAMPVLDLSGNIVPQRQFLSSIVPQTESPPVNSNMSTQSLLSSAVVSQTMSSQPVNVIPQSPTSTIISQIESNQSFNSSVNMQPQDWLQTPPAIVIQTTSSQPVYKSGNMMIQNQLPEPTTIVSQTASTPAAQSCNVNMIPQNLSPTLTIVSQVQSATAYTPPVLGTLNQLPNQSTSPFQDPLNMMTQGQFRHFAQVTPLNSVAAIEQDIRQLGATYEAQRGLIAGTNGNVETGFQTTNVASGLHDPSTISNASMTSLSNPPALPTSSHSWLPPGLVTLANASDTVQREQCMEGVTSNADIPNVQENLDLQVPEPLIDSFLENVKSTGKLKISLTTFNNGNFMEKLNALDASTINIHTVEIESTCKVHQALRFSLPSCLTILRINDNNLNYKDVSDLYESLSTVNNLHELSLSHTRFKDNAFISFLNVLTSCSSLRKLCLTDNGLTKQQTNFLIPAFESMKDLVNLNLSKSNLTETQANDILRKDGEGKCIVSLDLSQNALQGNKIINGICQLQSLEELNLSHNHINFFPLPNLEKQREHLPINTTTISLSSNNMTPVDVGSFCFFIKSNLMKLNLDFNHVGNSIWSLCTQGFKHLKVLSLANTDICGPAVQGLFNLLSLVGELEELNLSSNNLVLADFQQLQSPLSNLTQLKRLNLSNNPDGVLVILHEILPSLKYLEELGLSNVHLNGDGLNKICHSLASLKGLKHLDLSRNAIGPDGTRALANILKEFPLLEGLDMSKTCMKENEISVLCKGLVPLNRLKYLNLSGNRIDIQVIRDPVFLPPMLEELIFSEIINGEKLFSSMSFLQHLRKLHLSEINLRPCDVEALTAMLLSRPFLEELVLAKIVCTDCEKIFSAIKTLKNIKKIDLTGMKIPDGNAFAEMLSSLLSLEELVLTNMNGTNKKDGIIFSKIKLLKNLRKLHLDGIKIWDKKAFLDMLSSLSFLEDIVFPRVNLVHTDDKTFSALKSLRYLKNLDLRVTCNTAEYFASVLPSLMLLEKLVLVNNNIDSVSEKQVFAAVGGLTYLKELELKWDKITQAGADSLAEVLPSLQLLEKLVLENVDCDDIDDEIQKQLFAAVGKLTYLKELELKWDNISQAGADSLAEVLPSLKLLEKLVLEYVDCDNNDDSMGNLSGKQLFAAIGKLTYLKELKLKWWTITQAGAYSLAEVLPSLQLLEKLVLGFVDCNNHDETEKQLFTAVGKLTCLKELKLRLHNITQAGADSLAVVLPSLQLLEKIELYKFDGDSRGDLSGKQLLAAVGKLTYLKELKLQLCTITQADADTLAEVLPSLLLLEKLVLHYVNYDDDIDDESGKQLFAVVEELTYLKEFELGWCTITQAGADSLVEVLPSLQLLEKLVLKKFDFDDIDGECGKQLFAAVGKLTYLKELELEWWETTQIIQACADRLVDVLPSLPQLLEKLVLIKFDYGDDESGKQLFAAVGKLTYLKELKLHWFKITQAGADSLAQVLPSLQLVKLVLHHIDFRNINDQQLFGAVGSLSYLKDLDLSFTKITNAGAEILIDALPSLRNLRGIMLYDIFEPLRSRLIAAASQVPGLKVTH